MGVPARIILYAPDADAGERAAAAAYNRLAELDAMMSDYRIASDLNRISDQAGGPGASVPDDLFEILQLAQRVSDSSDGAFDVTLGPSVALWRRARKTGVLPTPDELAAARSLAGWRMMHLNQADRTVRLEAPGMRLDLGGIAKGYAAQRAVETLRAHGLDHVMVALAGDIVVADPPPGERAWRIAVVGDRSQPAEGGMTLLLRNTAVSTSGDSQQFVEIAGRRYSHIMDPHTGLGMTALRSVTVVAPTGEQADALSTAACVLGPIKGKALLKQWGASGTFQEGGVSERTSPAPGGGGGGGSATPEGVSGASAPLGASSGFPLR